MSTDVNKLWQQLVVARAQERVGKARYVYGAAGELDHSGTEQFDCSGFTKVVYLEAAELLLTRLNLGDRASAYVLPHNSLKQSEQLFHPRAAGMPIATGDVLFYYQPISHCGIAVRSGKTVSVIQASSPEWGVNEIGANDWATVISVGRPYHWLMAIQHLVDLSGPVESPSGWVGA